MKKVLAISTLAVLTLAFGLVQAGPNCGKKADGSSVSATKSGCSASASAKMTAVGSACGAHADMASAYCSPKECAEMKAKYGDKLEMHMISVKGMTCGSCENTVTTALKNIEGVIKVATVSYKDEIAVVCVDKTVAKSDMLTKAIADKGFQAEIVPAVAMTNAGSADSKASCANKTDAEKKACCAAKGKASKASADPQ